MAEKPKLRVIESIPHELVGRVVVLPSGERAEVLDVEHEYDDGTTLRYLDGPYAGGLTMRDTFAIRRYPAETPEGSGE